MARLIPRDPPLEEDRSCDPADPEVDTIAFQLARLQTDLIWIAEHRCELESTISERTADPDRFFDSLSQ